MPNDRYLKPANRGNPKLPVPIDSTTAITYRQQQEAARLGTVEGGSPVTQSVSLEPGERQLDIYWRGTSAQQIADLFREDILNDPAVATVELGTQGAGSQPSDGQYSIATNRTTVQRVDPKSDLLWRAEIVLSESPA